MYKQYLKQTLAALKENPLISLISIIGTALAIAMIMVLVISYEVKTANYKPESNRNRTLYVKRGNNAEMVVNPMIFIYAFLFCLVLNLLSAGIPAWRASRENIVYALNEI